MTTTDAAKLREAAQRLFSADSDYWFAIDHKPIASADAQLLARHILATVPEELPVPEWLDPLMHSLGIQPTKTDTSKL